MQLQQTSIDALESVQPCLNGLMKKVFDYLSMRGENGATDDEIQMALAMKHQSETPVRRNLVLMWKVTDSGQRRPTRSGRKAIVWVVRQEREPRREHDGEPESYATLG